MDRFMKFGPVCGPLLGPGLLNRDQTRTDRNIPSGAPSSTCIKIKLFQVLKSEIEI